MAAIAEIPDTVVSVVATDISPVIRIALVSDVHTIEGAQGDQLLYRKRMEQTIAEVNEANVDVVVISGDLSEHGTDAEFTAFQKQAKKLNAPILLVPGNHDVGNKTLPGGADSAVRMEWVERYESHFGPSFWTKTLAGLRFIGINSLIMGSGLIREEEQWDFLESELAQPCALPTIFITHQPPFLETPDEPGGDYWNIEPEPRARLLGLLAQGRVVACLSGHIHRPLANQIEILLFLTTHPVAFGLPPGKQPEGWTLITVQTETGHATLSYERRNLPPGISSC